MNHPTWAQLIYFCTFDNTLSTSVNKPFYLNILSCESIIKRPVTDDIKLFLLLILGKERSALTGTIADPVLSLLDTTQLTR